MEYVVEALVCVLPEHLQIRITPPVELMIRGRVSEVGDEQTILVVSAIHVL